MAGGSTHKTQLTKGAKNTSPTSSPTYSSYTSRSSFEFPTLNEDGSVPDLIETHPPRGQRTPPAALSSLGLKMAGDITTDGLTDLNDGQYDMVDDASDVSNDSNETVSIASDNLTSDDDHDILTPDEREAGTLGDLEDMLQMPAHPSAMSSMPDSFRDNIEPLRVDSKRRQKLRKAREEHAAQKEWEIEEREKSLESFLSEDLETPRQSTMNTFNMSSSADTVADATTAGNNCDMSGQLKPAKESSKRPSKKSARSRLRPSVASLSTMLAVWVVYTIYMGMFSVPSFEVTTRRDALSTALVTLTSSSNATKSFNIKHLLPVPTTLNSTNIFGRPDVGTSKVHFQGVRPNHIIVSLPMKAGQKGPQVASTLVYKGDNPIDFNQTKLIDGVYAITLDPHDSYGIVTVAMPCRKPDLNITVSHNFGHRYLTLPNFEKTRTDLSNTVTKDVAVARARARDLTDRVAAGIVATHNVSSHLAHQVGHEAQIIASTAASMVGKLCSTCPTTAEIRKDIIAIQDGFARAETQVDDFVADVAGRVKRSVMEPLALAQDRAGRIRAKYFGGEAAREKVCKRNVPAKHFTAPLLSPPKKIEKEDNVFKHKMCGGGKKACGCKFKHSSPDAQTKAVTIPGTTGKTPN